MKIRQSPSRVTNRLKGLIPTLYNFTTDPTNLANVTDEDWTTVSGTGVRICTAGYEVVQIRYDLGSVRTVLLCAKVGIWATAGAVQVMFMHLVGFDWLLLSGWQPAVTVGSTSEYVCYCASILVRERYIGLQILNPDAGVTNSIKLYEFAALEFSDFIGKN